MKYSFKNDYSEGCHPSILEALVKYNVIQEAGYGLDEFSLEAKAILKEKMNSPSSKIHFVSGGTQANLIMISSFLRPYQSVISTDHGHIFTNETAAIEATGHKVHAVDTKDGKITISDIQNVLDAHTNIPHQVQPKLVYISNSTELGTIYKKEEVKALYQFCQENDLFLMMDGARLGQALSSDQNDMTLEDCANFTDAFYIGGTKNGALLGEAIVINNIDLQEGFEFSLKQKGALLAKGRLLGIQFLTLFRDDLYFELGQHANSQSMKIKNALQNAGYQFYTENHTNQLFPIIPNDLIEKLSEKFDFYVWKKIDEKHGLLRIITSWNTPNEAVEDFINLATS